MTTPASGVVRSVRAAAFALAAISLGLGAHALGGDARPSLLAFSVAVLAVGCASTLATGRRIGRLAATGGLALAQAGLHTWFSVAGGHGCDVGGIVLTGHHVALQTCPPGGSSSAVLAQPVHQLLPGGLAMPLAHVLVVMLTGLLLARGDQALWRLAAGVRRCVPRLPVLDAVVSTVRPAATLVAAPPAFLVPVALRTPSRRRGPPAIAALA